MRVAGRGVAGPQTDLGIVFQSPVLLDWRTALANVLVQVELRGMDPRAYRERALDLLAKVGLADFADRYPHELSGGMRQRVAIARALIHDAPLLLMDEPFGALDALTREQMRLDLEALWLATRKTVLFITHSIDEAVLLADRVVVMSPRPGRIEQIMDIGLPRPRGLDARRAPEFSAATEHITDIFLARGVLHGAAPITPQGLTAMAAFKLEGIVAAPVLPMLPDFSIDWTSLRSYIRWIADQRPTAIAMNMDASEGPVAGARRADRGAARLRRSHRGQGAARLRPDRGLHAGGRALGQRAEARGRGGARRVSAVSGVPRQSGAVRR